MHEEKEIRWVGSAYQDLLELPEDARRSAGFQLRKVQAGLDPDDWKPFNEIGPGTKEIRLFESGGTYRVMYVAKFPEAVMERPGGRDGGGVCAGDFRGARAAPTGGAGCTGQGHRAVAKAREEQR